MKITKITTIPVVASGWMSGVMKAPSVCSAPGSGCRTSTGIGWTSLLPATALRVPATADWSVARPPVWPIEFFPQVLEHVSGPFQGAAARGRAADRGNLLAHGALIARQVARELRHLGRHQAGKTGDRGKRDQDNADDREGAWNTGALEKAYRRRENKAEENGEGHRHEDLSPDAHDAQARGADAGLDVRARPLRGRSTNGEWRALPLPKPSDESGERAKKVLVDLPADALDPATRAVTLRESTEVPAATLPKSTSLRTGERECRTSDPARDRGFARALELELGRPGPSELPRGRRRRSRGDHARLPARARARPVLLAAPRARARP